MKTDRGFSLVLDVRCRLGEGPVWSREDQALWFTDIEGRALHRFVPATGAHATVSCDEEVGCFALSAEGTILAAMRSGVWSLDRGGRKLEELARNPEDTRLSRFNDGGTDPRGRFWLGTKDDRKQGGAHLYRYDRRGLVAVEDDIDVSNGVAFSPDGRFLYHSDTPRFTVYRYAYDVETGEARDRRVFLRFDPESADRARPDGGAVDAEGCYWTALFEGGRVQRYAPDGELLGEYPLPARCPTMPAFGGADMKTLFVTTARTGRSAAELDALPHSGSLFAMSVDVPGVVRPPFDPRT